MTTSTFFFFLLFVAVNCFPQAQNGASPNKDNASYDEDIIYTCPPGESFDAADHSMNKVTVKCLANNTVQSLLKTCKGDDLFSVYHRCD